MFVFVKAIVVIAAIAVPSTLLMSEATFRELAADLLERTNIVREEYVQRALAPNAQLERAAEARANDLALRGYFSHVSPDGRVLDDFLRDAGYQYAVAGENLAMGFTDMDTVIATWLASPSHRRNLIAADYDDVGIGIARGLFDGRPVLYIVEHYGRRQQYGAAVAALPVIDATASQVSWSDVADGTAFAVRVRTLIPADRVEASVAGVTIPLHPTTDDAQTFTGGVTLPERPAQLFAVSVLPAVAVEHAGETSSAYVSWDRPYAPRASVRELYESGAAYLVAAAPLLVRTARAIFLLALIAFTFTLGVGLRSELRKKHPHLLGRAAALIGILVVFLIL